MRKIKALIISIVVMAVIGTLLMAGSSLVISKMQVYPCGALPLITTIIACVAVLLGAFFCSLYAKEKGILFGVLTALIFAVCVCGISMLLFKEPFSIASLGKLAAVFISGSIGGILGVNRKSKVKF